MKEAEGRRRRVCCCGIPRKVPGSLLVTFDLAVHAAGSEQQLGVSLFTHPPFLILPRWPLRSSRRVRLEWATSSPTLICTELPLPCLCSPVTLLPWSFRRHGRSKEPMAVFVTHFYELVFF